MLTIVTGQPGNGKTLLALSLVEQLRQKSGRDVYQHGIKDLSLPWKPLDDPKKWHELPDGSIIVIDEAWSAFPVRRQGSEVPSHVQAMATYRHRGLDIVLVTQRHLQLDTFIRGLAGRHIEVVRRFGVERATLYQWEKVVDPSSEQNRKDALVTKWSYPKESYSWYKSAEIHTRQRDFPVRKLALLVGAGAVVAVGIGYAVWHVRHGFGIKANPAVSVVPEGAPKAAVVDPWAYETRRARLVGVPESARLYDQLQEQRSQPSPAGCMMLAMGSAVQCTCTTDQGSKLEISVSRCVSMVQRGWFDGTRGSVDAKAENIAYLNARDGVDRSASSGGKGSSPAGAGQSAGGGSSGS